MNPTPKPRTDDERVFVSGYRYDSIRSFLVRVVIPTLGFVPLIGIPLFSWRFYQSMEGQVSDDAHRQLVMFLLTLNLVGLFMAFSFFFLAAYLRRKIFDTYVIYKNQEIILKTGPKEVKKLWADLKDLKIRDMGRVQTATLVFDKGKITFDASMIDNAGPKPVVRMTMKGEQFRFPNLNVQDIKILENDLYGVVKRRFDKMKK
ncbi:MAG: hypothetical protein KC994_24480 [Candidatus Omnitrophica bacterium]|nr:hypothetical protein [Candidatus Omnitrophota bacterium]